MEEIKVNKVIKDNSIVSFAIMDVKDEPGVAFNIFETLAKKNINIDIIMQSVGRDNSKDISFTVAKKDKDVTLEALLTNRERLGFKNISVTDKVCKITIFGSGMLKSSGFASTIFDVLYEKNINIHIISTSEISISILIDSEMADVAEQVIRQKLFEL